MNRYANVIFPDGRMPVIRKRSKVRIDHAGGYRTTFGHLSAIEVVRMLMGNFCFCDYIILR